jgi:hypothetical protein
MGYPPDRASAAGGFLIQIRRRLRSTGAVRSIGAAFCVAVLACSFGLVGGPAAATAADDPVPTTPEPAPDPAPDPAPVPAPAPKPKPKPAPVRPAPTPTPVVTPSPEPPAAAVVPSRSPRPTAHKPTKKKAVHRTQARTPKPVVPARVVKPVKAARSLPANRTAATIAPSKPFDYGSLVFLTMIAIAVACFTVAAIPATVVPWRSAAHFIALRHIDFAIIGLALLLLAGVTFMASGN